MIRLLPHLPTTADDRAANERGALSTAQRRTLQRHAAACVGLILLLLAIKFALVYVTFFTAMTFSPAIVLGYGLLMWVSIAWLTRHGWRVLRESHNPQIEIQTGIISRSSDTLTLSNEKNGVYSLDWLPRHLQQALAAGGTCTVVWLPRLRCLLSMDYAKQPQAQSIPHASSVPAASTG